MQLLPGHDRRLRAGSPWAFSNELRIDAAARRIAPGSLVRLHNAHGRALGAATFNVHSLIAARVMSLDEHAVVDAPFLGARIAAALRLRQRLISEPYYRLVHAEADGLPGIIVDRYGDVLAVQTNTAGAEALLPALLAAFDDVLCPNAIVLRNDAPVRALEGLPGYVRLAKGQLDGPIGVVEGSARFLADLLAGQKTGWFFDLREARQLMAKLATGGRVLDLYCHTGGFTISAALGGAREAIAVDRSAPALALAKAAAERAKVASVCRFEAREVFADLAERQARGETFETVIADPPSFVKARKDLKAGIKGYRKLARLAAALVAPGGFLFVASCSHHVSVEDFGAEVARGLTAAGRSGRIVAAGGAGPDHPIHPHLAESAYLKWQALQLD
ncbi:MAG TPA: class I SAM-dependent rRNA methyltransferase [Candidatus Cybelea sp.]|nr:class I SAM-dependent rRNA methyltransferase [Candidatus Cybelea sp.]